MEGAPCVADDGDSCRLAIRGRTSKAILSRGQHSAACRNYDRIRALPKETLVSARQSGLCLQIRSLRAVCVQAPDVFTPAKLIRDKKR